MVFTKQIVLKRSVSEETMNDVAVGATPFFGAVDNDAATAGTVTHSIIKKDDTAINVSGRIPSSKKKAYTNVGTRELRPADVLMGRGTGPNQSSGNVRFRALVQETFAKYMEKQQAVVVPTDDERHSTTDPSSTSPSRGSITLDALTKKKLAYRVLYKIKEEKGRFLQKLSKDEAEIARSSGAVHKSSHVVIDVDNTVDEYHQGIYMEISDRQAIEKIKQTYRFIHEQKAGIRRRPARPVLLGTEAAAQKKRADPSPPPTKTSSSPLTSTVHGVKGGSNVLPNSQQPREQICPAPVVRQTLLHPLYSPSVGGTTRSPPISLGISEMGILSTSLQHRRMAEENSMALRVAEEEAAFTNTFLTRLLHQLEAERENRKQLIRTELAMADAERVALISNRLQVLKELERKEMERSSILSSMRDTTGRQRSGSWGLF